MRRVSLQVHRKYACDARKPAPLDEMKYSLAKLGTSASIPVKWVGRYSAWVIRRTQQLPVKNQKGPRWARIQRARDVKGP